MQEISGPHVFPSFLLQIFHLIKFLHCNSRSCQNLTQPLHVCSQPEKEKNNWGQCGFLQNTWQGRGGAGSYVAAEGHSCSRAPGRRPPSPPRWSPAPWPSGWTARRKSWHGLELALSSLQCKNWRQETISTKLCKALQTSSCNYSRVALRLSQKLSKSRKLAERLFSN